MRKLAILILLITLHLGLSAQESNSNKTKADGKTASEEENVVDEKEEFEKAIQKKNAKDRITSLIKFVKDFPESTRKTRALENIVGSRAELADEKLRIGETETGTKLFMLAVRESPTPVSDKLFSNLLLKFPANLFFRGQGKAAFDVAELIEEKVGNNPKQMLPLATFYLSAENGLKAKNLAEKVIELNPESAAAYYTLGFANRLNFDLNAAAKAFQKALELDPESVNTKTSLAEMKRALGLPEDAIALYREVLEKDETNSKAKTGLVLSLFDFENKTDAELEMEKELTQNPNNLPLLVGAAYWYAAHKDGDKAVELAQRVIAFQPRYIWTYIALARGYMAQGNPLAAERAILTARKYGNFPTLSYELASARFAAGFNREAGEGLKKAFEIEGDLVKTKLGGRIERKAETFIDLLSYERRASIFQVNTADDPLNSLLLKNLLNFMEKVENKDADDESIALAADQFISGSDKMKTYRQLFVADQLLQRKKSLSKVIEITKDAVIGVDSALEVESPSSSVLAEQLYESRRLSLTRGRTVIVPDIPRQTLSKIVRGRIEEIAGWALFQQEKSAESKIRLKRAIGILPKDSTWWRSSLWKLGTVLESEGKQADALDAYIRGYSEKEQSTVKKIVIEGLYRKINGSLEGLDDRLKSKPAEPETASIFTKKPEKTKKKKLDEEESSTEIEKLPEDLPLVDTTDVKDNSDSNSGNPKTDRVPKPSDSKTAEENLVGLNSNSPEKGKLAETEDRKKKILSVEGLEKGKQLAGQIESKTNQKVTDQTLFDPIIIDVPSEAAKKNQDNPEKSKKDSPIELTENPSKKGVEDSGETKTLDKKELENKNKGPENLLVRPRVVSEKNSEKVRECAVVVSQEVVSIINNGGSLGVLVGLEKYKEKTPILKAVSSDPDDIEVKLEPGIGAMTGQSFFIIKSISERKGTYNVVFETPCGKKKIEVKVR